MAEINGICAACAARPHDYDLLVKINKLLEADVGRVQAERDKLAAFKAWVHAYLDSRKVPTHPEGVHGREGCRIGDRMDLVFAELEQLRGVVTDLDKAAADELLERFDQIEPGLQRKILVRFVQDREIFRELAKELFADFDREYGKGIGNGYWPDLAPLYYKAKNLLGGKS